jgi:hypothetical protein
MANKKLFGAGTPVTTPTGSKLLAFGNSTTAAQNITITDFSTWVIAQIPPPPTTTLLTRVVDIGGYDMNGSSGDRNKELNLGVQRDKIRGIVVTIISNTGGLYTLASPVEQVDTSPQIRSWWRIFDGSTYAANARIKLYSKDRGYFDQGAFDGTGINRGYITIWYVE